MWVTNSSHIARELAKRKRGGGNNKEDDIAAIMRWFKGQLRSEGMLGVLGEGLICCEEVSSELQNEPTDFEEECWDDVNGRRLDELLLMVMFKSFDKNIFVLYYSTMKVPKRRER